MGWLLPLALLSGGAATAAMRLGVNTHFDQGWPLAAFGQVTQAQAGGIRDTIGWGKVEQAPGRYDFTPANSGYIDRACAAQLPVLLTLTPRNRIYDNGETVFSPEGRRAFAAFAATVVKRYPCIEALEIGNEINGHSLKGRMLESMPQSYIAILQDVRKSVSSVRKGLRILSGSSLSVATGFFDRLFDAGLLPLVDGIVVHPYLPVPEQLPRQLDRLKQAMAKHGSPKPIWASEFSFTYASPNDAPPHALKMISLLSAAGVQRADWYALRDEKYYPNMGLFAGGTPKPAFDSFRAAQTRLLAAGDARRIDMGDPLAFVYRFGNGPYVMWGANRPIAWGGKASAWDARGRPIALPTHLDDAPVIIETSAPFHLGAKTVVDDTLTNFGGSDWSWFVAGANGTRQPLQWQDWNWTSYIGTRAFPNFRVMGGAVSTARPRSGAASSLIERYTAPVAGKYFVSACFEGTPQKPTSVRIAANGRDLFSADVTGLVRTAPLPVAAGGPVDIVYTASAQTGPRVLRRRIRILASPDQRPAQCAPKGVDGQQE